MVTTRSKARRSDENGSQRSQAVNNGAAPKSAAVAVQSSVVFRVILPLFLVGVCPNFMIWLWHTIHFHNGSLQEFAMSVLNSPNPLAYLANLWSSVDCCSPFAITVLGTYIGFQLLLMKIVPGPRAEGPITPKGNKPVYVDNGFSIYCITMVSFLALSYYLKMYTPYSPSMVYDRFGDILATLNIFSLLFCVMLYFKGMFFPSSTDSGTSGNPLFDYYWGTELYPRIFGWDIKVLTNCRFGCTVWALFPMCFAFKSYELYGFEASINMYVSLAILLVYLTKFFWWEAGYMCTIDIILDRAGFYICWGCLVWIPGLYTVFSFYLVSHPIALGYPKAAAILLAGLSCVTINYVADWQKQAVRANNGNCNIWGRKAEVIRAKFTTSKGEEKTSLLLVSGFWGLARHFHYLPELGLAFFWTMPCGFNHILPYSYFIFLFVLLVHRTFRDDIKCEAKYGPYWHEYRKRVPCRIIPYVF